MNESDIMNEYRRLWDSFASCREVAEEFESPNPEDDGPIKMAIVGFSFHDRTENWARGHFEIAKQYLDESVGLGASLPAQEFSMLALGALLGMYSASKIDDRLYGAGYALLPGFVLASGAEVDKLGSTTCSCS